MGRTKLLHTKRRYLIKYSAERYQASPARVAELPVTGTARQYAIILGLDPMVLYRWIYNRGLPVDKVGEGLTSPWQIEKGSFLEWLEEQGFRASLKAPKPKISKYA